MDSSCSSMTNRAAETTRAAIAQQVAVLRVPGGVRDVSADGSAARAEVQRKPAP